MDTEHIRNFSIIAHIDHGKSTLADRLIEITGTVQKRDMEAQILDTMELERERGITIKEQSVRLNYTYEDGETYELNLIDTPGHVDFNYEVSRSLSACEGAILIIDATQGVQAQTLANVYLALDHDLEIIPVINKVDLPSADVERVKTEVENVIGLDMSEAIPVSAKTGQNVEEVLKRIVEQVPPPEDHSKAPLRCLIFDSIFDSYKGAIAYVRVKDGEIRAGMNIRMMASGKVYTVPEALRRPQLRLSRLRGSQHQECLRLRGGGYHHDRRGRRQRSTAGLPQGTPDGFLRSLPDREQGL